MRIIDIAMFFTWIILGLFTIVLSARNDKKIELSEYIIMWIMLIYTLLSKLF